MVLVVKIKMMNFYNEMQGKSVLKLKYRMTELNYR